MSKIFNPHTHIHRTCQPASILFSTNHLHRTGALETTDTTKQHHLLPQGSLLHRRHLARPDERRCRIELDTDYLSDGKIAYSTRHTTFQLPTDMDCGLRERSNPAGAAGLQPSDSGLSRINRPMFDPDRNTKPPAIIICTVLLFCFSALLK